MHTQPFVHFLAEVTSHFVNFRTVSLPFHPLLSHLEHSAHRPCSHALWREWTSMERNRGCHGPCALQCSLSLSRQSASFGCTLSLSDGRGGGTRVGFGEPLQNLVRDFAGIFFCKPDPTATGPGNDLICTTQHKYPATLESLQSAVCFVLESICGAAAARAAACGDDASYAKVTTLGDSVLPWLPTNGTYC